MTFSMEALVAYITDDLGVADEIGSETELFSSGILDSVAMMNIIGFIEAQTGIDVRAADVTLENFDSVQRIADYVARET